MTRSTIAFAVVIMAAVAGCGGGSDASSEGPGTYEGKARGATVTLALPTSPTAGDVAQIESYRRQIGESPLAYGRLTVRNDGDETLELISLKIVTDDRRTLELKPVWHEIELPEVNTDTALYNHGVDLYNAFLDEEEVLPGATAQTLVATTDGLAGIKSVNGVIGSSLTDLSEFQLKRSSDTVEAADPGPRVEAFVRSPSGQASSPSAPEALPPSAADGRDPDPAELYGEPNGECERVADRIIDRIESKPGAGVSELVLPSAYRLEGRNGTVIGGFVTGVGPDGDVDGEFGSWFLATTGTLFRYTGAALGMTAWPMTGDGLPTPLSERVETCAAANAG